MASSRTFDCRIVNVRRARAELFAVSTLRMVKEGFILFICCFSAAALATGCKVDVKQGCPYNELHQNPVLGGASVLLSASSSANAQSPAQSFADIVGSRYGLTTYSNGSTASTDFVGSRFPFSSLSWDPNKYVSSSTQGNVCYGKFPFLLRPLSHFPDFKPFQPYIPRMVREFS